MSVYRCLARNARCDTMSHLTAAGCRQRVSAFARVTVRTLRRAGGVAPRAGIRRLGAIAKLSNIVTTINNDVIIINIINRISITNIISRTWTTTVPCWSPTRRSSSRTATSGMRLAPDALPLASCDILTHTPARESSTNVLLYSFVPHDCSTNYLGHRHGYECHIYIYIYTYMYICYREIDR